MSVDFDTFSITLLDESKRFLEKFEEDNEEAFLHAALVLGFSALESHVNGIADELSLRDNMSTLDKSLLLERSIKLEKGEWKLVGSQFSRLEDRLRFMFRRGNNTALGDYHWWGDLNQGILTRNDLVHPKKALELKVDDVKRFLAAIVSALNDLYLAVFDSGHPAHGRGLQSTMSF